LVAVRRPDLFWRIRSPSPSPDSPFTPPTFLYGAIGAPPKSEFAVGIVHFQQSSALFRPSRVEGRGQSFLPRPAALFLCCPAPFFFFLRLVLGSSAITCLVKKNKTLRLVLGHAGLNCTLHLHVDIPLFIGFKPWSGPGDRFSHLWKDKVSSDFAPQDSGGKILLLGQKRFLARAHVAIARRTFSPLVFRLILSPLLQPFSPH